MKKRALFILVILTLLPVVIAGVIGWQMIEDEQRLYEMQFADLSQDKLKAVDQTIQLVIRQIESQLERIEVSDDSTDEALSLLIWNSPLIRQLWIIEDGKLKYPVENVDTLMGERLIDHVRQTQEERADQSSWTSKRSTVSQSIVQKMVTQQRSYIEPELKRSGWFVWFSKSRINPVYWQQNESGNVIGYELINARLIAEIVGSLPMDTDATARVRLLDANQNVLHQWGRYSISEDEKPISTLALIAPLGSWHLEYYAQISGVNGLLSKLVFAGILAGIVLLVAIGGWVLYREYAREIRQAQQRVSFVNQVSHELKTPLTSIRMYAELLEENLLDEDEQNRHFVKVITHESQRLSRLINNVLTFAGLSKNSRQLHLSECVVDKVINDVIMTCRPSLTSKGIEILFEGHAPVSVTIDSDVLGQILHNLLGNVEKYAASGKWVEITSRYDNEKVTVTVQDYGPGIAADHAQRIFEPFVRLSSDLSEGVTGTGIGLSIARDLARLHGGDLKLVESQQGACFELFIKAKPSGGADENTNC